MAILKQARKHETDLLGIAGLAIGGGILLYSLARNAGGISDFIGKIFGAFGSNIESNIVGALSGGGQSTGSDGLHTVAGGGRGDSSVKYATQGSSGRTLPPAETSGQPTLNVDYIAVKDYNTNQEAYITSEDLNQAGKILGGFQNPVNLAKNPNIRLAENTLIAGLGQHDAQLLTGETKVVGLFKVPGGSVVPLTQNAVDYYNKIHVGISEIVAY